MDTESMLNEMLSELATVANSPENVALKQTIAIIIIAQELKEIRYMLPDVIVTLDGIANQIRALEHK